MQVLQRHWYGSPRDSGELFILKESPRGYLQAAHVGTQAEVVLTQVCGNEDEVLTTGEQWKAAMIEKGWELRS